MIATYIDLSWWQVAIAAALVIINAVISIALQLGLGQQLLIAVTRMIVQLALVGHVLKWIFQLDQFLAVLALISLMTVIAGSSAVTRCEHRFPGIYGSSLLSVWGSSWIVAAVAVGLVIRADPWWQAQYSIPLVGMILGNALSGISLGMDRFLAELQRERAAIEANVCMGATRWEALRPTVRSALRTGMVPILNTMAVAGIVSLPGMMTGQILSGVEPLAAVKYQIVIMCLIATTVSLGTLAAVLLSYCRLTTPQHTVRWSLLSKFNRR